MTEHKKEESGVRELFLRTVAIVGLVAVLLLGAWGIILIAFNLPNLFSTLGGSVSSLFAPSQQPESATPAIGAIAQDTPATVPTTKSNAAVAAKSTATASTGGASAKYVASGTRTNLYGAADLSVRILSVVPAGARTNVQFEVQNIGSNVTPSNWTFDAQLPLTPAYTYRSQGQQALYPGDKIVYTIGFDTPYTYTNWYCTLQYPNYNCPQYNYSYNNQYPYNYYNSGTCYHYDGYNNYPTTCPGVNYNQNYYSNYIYGSSNYAYLPQQTGRLVTVTVDPYNLVADYNRANNTASVSI
ncbi:hypothetical protein HYS79_01615 [Patescibacteria group bacterium]|nr:hypothetical protein [Patescibacteria group bacterium]